MNKTSFKKQWTGIKNCKRCNKEYIATAGSRKYCDECIAELTICPECGKKKSLYHKFCSNSCAGKWNYRNSKKVREALLNGSKYGHLPEERNFKISKVRLGKPRYDMRGENNPNWNGGTYGTERHKDMCRVEYSEWRTKVFTRDNFTCCICHKVGGILNAHHIKSWKNYKGICYDINNGITMCEKCHKEYHKQNRLD